MVWIKGRTRDDFDVSGRESNPHLPVCTGCSGAVELPGSITEVQRPDPKSTTDKERDGKQSVARLRGGRTRLSRKNGTLPDNPNSTARRNWRARWASNPHLPDVSGRSVAVEQADCPRIRANFGRSSRMRFCCHLGRIRWARGDVDGGTPVGRIRTCTS